MVITSGLLLAQVTQSKRSLQLYRLFTGAHFLTVVSDSSRNHLAKRLLTLSSS